MAKAELMKLVITAIILTFILIFQTSCNESSGSTTGDMQQRVSDLEKRVATLEEETTAEGSIPQVFEKTIPTVLRTVGYPEWKDNQSLRFRLETGDKIDGEITIIGGTTNDLICTVRDPYGNVLLQSSTRMEYFTITSLESGKKTMTRLVNTQQYPWRFTFIASTSGEYILEIYREISSSNNTTGAHLKVTVNQ